MRVLITGAAGFIGQIVAQELLSDASNQVLLTDIVEPPIPSAARHPENAKSIKADLINETQLIARNQYDTVLLFHGIMSSGAEASFDLGYQVNVDATRALLFALIDTNPGVRVIYASSGAVYGQPCPKKGVNEDNIPNPQSSYGCQKIICETYINDLTRRGKINGFTLRFPTISVRAGAPTAAASSFLSGIIREPLNGQRCVLPLQDRKWQHWMCSPRTLVYNVLIAMKLDRESLPLHRRSVNVPGFAVTIQEMLDALAEVGGKDSLKLVEEKEDADLKPLLYSWPDDFDNSLGLGLGMKQDTSFLQLVRDYAKLVGINQNVQSV